MLLQRNSIFYLRPHNMMEDDVAGHTKCEFIH